MRKNFTKVTGTALIEALANKNISKVTINAKRQPSDVFKERVAGYGFECTVYGKPGKYNVVLLRAD